MFARLRRDGRGAVSVEYLLLAGCVALATVFGFQSFGGAIDDKVQCQAASVASLSIDGCASGTGTASDFAGVEVSGSAQTQDERDCGGWNAISCAVSSLGDFAATAGETLGDQVANVFGDTVGNFVGDYASTAWQLPVGMAQGVLPLFGLGGEGASGVVDSWQATGKQLTALGCAGLPGACQTLNSGIVPGFAEGEVMQLQIDTGKSFVGWDHWANGEYGQGAGTLLPTIAIAIVGTKGVGGGVSTGARVATHADADVPNAPDDYVGPMPPNLGSPTQLSRQHYFFKWPDFHGKKVTPLPNLRLATLPPKYRRDLEQFYVRYLTPEALARLELRAQDGRLVGADGKPYTSGNSVGNVVQNEYSLYVVGPDGKLYAWGAEKRALFKHSSFLAGSPAAGAGEIFVKNGRITKINDSSGHYRPDLETSIAALRHLESQGVDLSGATFESWLLKEPVSVDDLLTGKYEQK